MQSWEELLIHAINDTNIDCFKDSEGSLDLSRLLCTSWGCFIFGLWRSLSDSRTPLENWLFKKCLNSQLKEACCCISVNSVKSDLIPNAVCATVSQSWGQDESMCPYADSIFQRLIVFSISFTFSSLHASVAAAVNIHVQYKTGNR